jgi:hypothetical protein
MNDLLCQRQLPLWKRALQERLENAVLDCLTTLPTSDLESWRLRSYMWTSLDRVLDNVADDHRDHINRLNLLILQQN